MTDRGISERLQPSLLDRLCDDEPDNLQESRDRRVIDIRRLREIVQRDLSWLLNTNNSDQIIDPEIYPNIASSTLNFGVREVAGEFSTQKRAEAIRRSMHKAIERFEPRIKKGSLEVTIAPTETRRGTMINYDIRADMWAEPLPLEVYLRSAVDTNTGELTLERKG
jgi:type VI secretion system protein ImpF